MGQGDFDLGEHSRDAWTLARRLAVLPDPAMREASLVNYLVLQDAEVAIASFEFIRRRGVNGELPFVVALGTFVAVLCKNRLPYDDLERLYQCAYARGYEACARLLLADMSSKTTESAELFAMQPLTLGHRISQAKSTNRQLIARLLRFPEPGVIRVLLQNPRVTEPDVVRLAARRPTDSAVQLEIVLSDRWNSKPTVRRALVHNPATPVEISQRLLALLSRRDLLEVTRTLTIADSVREFAAKLLYR